MGSQLTNVAMATWAKHVSGRAFRVLIRMTMSALDTPSGDTPAATYFGGMDSLKMSLNRASERTVYRALQELVDVGAIESVQRGQKGRRAVYRLTLDNDPKPVDNLPQPDRTDTLPDEQPDKADTQSCQNCQAIDPIACQNCHHSLSELSPLGRTTNHLKTRTIDDEVVSFETDVQIAREDSAANDFLPVDEKRTNACPECDTYLDPDGSCFVCRRQMQMEAS